MKGLMADEVVTPSLKTMVLRISTESSVLDNMVQHLKEALPSLIIAIKDGVANFVSPTEDDLAAEVTRLNKSIASRLQGLGISQFDKTVVSVPEGFKGDFLEYALVLQELAIVVNSQTAQTLQTYQSILSSFITNKDNKLSLADHTHFIAQVKKNREDMQKAIARYFSNRTVAKARIPEVVGRLSDLQRLSEVTAALDKIRRNSNLSQLMASANTISELLETVHANIEAGQYPTISGAATKNIAEGAYEIGSAIEFVSVYSFRVDQLITSISSLFELIDRTID